MRISTLALLIGVLGAHSASAIVPPPHPSLPECARGDSQLLLPDLVADTPAFVRNALRGGRRFIEFETAVSNIGDGPLILDGRTVSTENGVVTQAFQVINKKDGTQCARHAGFFEYHRAHSHWHFGDFVNYELRKDNPVNGAEATTGVKASFCLIDLEQVRGYSTPRQLNNQTCNSQEGLQGISVGWKDVYERSLPDQNLDLDDPVVVPTGPYYLVNAVDGDNLLWEKNENNNRSYVQTSVSVGPSIFPTYPPVEATPTRGGSGSSATPTVRSGRPQHPVRAPRPTRRPVRPGRTVPAPASTPTATPRATEPPVGACPVTCPYALQQIRMTWYDAGSGGLNVSLFVRDSGCPTILPSAGDRGTLTMSRWLTGDGRDTGRLKRVTFDMSSNTSGATSDDGLIRFIGGRGGTLMTYTSFAPPIAGPGLGLDFPVVFDLCVNVGDQTFSGRLVCQEKPRGLLCHEG